MYLHSRVLIIVICFHVFVFLLGYMPVSPTHSLLFEEKKKKRKPDLLIVELAELNATPSIKQALAPVTSEPGPDQQFILVHR